MKWPQDFINKVIQGDALEIMRQIPDESVDMAITSPPYYGLRDYGKDVITVFGGNPDCKHAWQIKNTRLEHEYRQGIGSKTVKEKKEKGWHKQPSAFCSKCGAWKGQLGLEPHPQLYVKHLIEIFRELKRILKPRGSFYLNMGDTYCGSNQGYGQKRKSKTGFQFIGTGQYASSKYKTPQSQITRKEKWLQPKQLMLMPARIATALQKDGWILRNDIIYHKRNPLPSSVKDRLTNTYEHVFFFVKSKKYYYDLDSIREPHTSIKDLGRKRLDTKTPKHDLAIKQKAGKIGPSGYLVQHPLGKNPGDIIQINGDFIQPLIKEIYCRLDRNSKTYKGKNRCKNKNAKIIQVFDGKKIRDTAQEILKEKGIYSAELVEYIHDHFGHPLGKNPGDVLIERSDKRAVLSKKQKLHTFYSHSKRGAKFNNPLGKNPGDVILTKHDLAVNRVGNFTYADPLHAKAYNIKGKNSGDVAKYPPHEPRHFQLLQMGIQHGGNTGKTIRHDHLLGKNPGDFWTITVKPFPGAHFAVYPQEICIKPIKASCPEFVCKKCGKPIMNKTSGTKGFGDSFNIRVRDMQIQPEKWGSLYKASEEEKKKYNEREYRHKNTRQKDIIKCDCNAGFEPGIVLDIFAGSGTTGAVAKKLGRRYILIELKPEYCKMARKRLKNA